MFCFKRGYSLFAGAVAMLMTAACGTVQADGPEKASAEAAPKVRVALFLDEGCRGNGALHWARMLARSPQIDLTIIDGKALRDGKLDGCKLLVCPGGGGAKQIGAMKPAGFRIVKKFVNDGGAYLGICAGSYNVMNRKGRFAFLPYDYIERAAGKLADITVELNGRGAELLGVKPGRFICRYNGGNIMRPTEPTGKGDGEVLAVFKSSSSFPDRAAYNFIDTPAMIYGQYGKGKVLAVSPHPESYESTRPIAMGMVRALIGVTPTPIRPAKVVRPLRVGFLSLACVGPRAAREMLALDRDPELDVEIFSTHEINERGLCHYDVIVMPAGEEKSYLKFKDNEFLRAKVDEFLGAGGRIVASGNGSKYLPQHENIRTIKVGTKFAPAVKGK